MTQIIVIMALILASGSDQEGYTEHDPYSGGPFDGTHAVLKGIVEQDNPAYFFHSTMGLKTWIHRTWSLRWINDQGVPTPMGLAVYEHRLAGINLGRSGRARYIDWPGLNPRHKQPPRISMASFKRLSPGVSRDDLASLLWRKAGEHKTVQNLSLMDLRKTAIKAIEQGRLYPTEVEQAVGLTRGWGYGVLISPGPLIAIRYRLPLEMPWTAFLKRLAPVMASHGMKAKDLWNIDPLLRDSPGFREEEDLLMERKMERAFHGENTSLPKFHLYELKKDTFKLTRKPAE